MSACETDGRTITKRLRAAYLKDELKRPPKYVFVFEDTEVDWERAVVTWTMFYKEAPRINLKAAAKKGGVQRLLNRVNRSGYGNLRYFRWDRARKRYLTYAATD